jgi:hypothetical protein
MYTNTHPHTPLDRQRARRHPLPSERASRSRILSAHLHSTPHRNKSLCHLAGHLLVHLAPPPLLRSPAQSLSKFILLLTTGGHGPNQLVSTAYSHDTFSNLILIIAYQPPISGLVSERPISPSFESQVCGTSPSVPFVLVLPSDVSRRTYPCIVRQNNKFTVLAVGIGSGEPVAVMREREGWGLDTADELWGFRRAIVRCRMVELIVEVLVTPTGISKGCG